jgi:hypothetical protein
MARDGRFNSTGVSRLSKVFTVGCQFVIRPALVILFSFGFLEAHAADPFESNLKYLKRHGITLLAGKAIDDLIEEGAKINIRIVDLIQFTGDDGSVRRSGK